MKVAILILIIFLVIIFFRFITNFKKQKNENLKNETIVDLEKDPKTDEYKPKK
tara:strand:- start:24 stop:182 length:159 start_codon:yes stop_codon:yes gene_type:complete